MLLEVKNLSKQFTTGAFKNKKFFAVDDVSFGIEEGEIFGLIGGSGSGKTTLIKMILGLLRPTAGEIIFDGQDLVKLKKKGWKAVRKDMQAVFQHPHQTFNPRGTIAFACSEPAVNYGLVKNRQEKQELIEGLISRVGLTKEQLKKYPHEISGGQAQRLSIIRAMSLEPKFLICDEPTSMLDVSVQAQILNLLKKKHKERNLGMLFISHDLEVIKSFCHRVAVMKDGRVVEMGTTGQVFEHPQDEYTKELLSSRMVY